jgi:hypothetical protein
MKKTETYDIKWNNYPERPSGEVEVTLEFVGKPDLEDHTYGWNTKYKDQ